MTLYEQILDMNIKMLALDLDLAKVGVIKETTMMHVHTQFTK